MAYATKAVHVVVVAMHICATAVSSVAARARLTASTRVVVAPPLITRVPVGAVTSCGVAVAVAPVDRLPAPSSAHTR